MKQLFAHVLKFAHKITRPLSGVWLHNTQRNRTLVLSGNQLLLVRSSFGPQKWSLPGGGKKKYEESVKSAERELFEETGVRSKKPLTYLNTMRLPAGATWPTYSVDFYVLRLNKKPPITIRRPLEILELNWFELDSLPEDCSNTVSVGLKLIR